MHEFSIAEQIVEQIVAVAAENSVTDVRTVELEIGAMEMIVNEALETAFAAAAAGTVAEGAKLVIETVPTRGVCGACGNEYETSIADYTCPASGAAQATITTGRGILLRGLDCLTEEEEENG